MDLSPMGHRSRGRGNFYDPFSFMADSFFDPRDLSIVERPRHRGDGGQVTGRTSMDWIETPESHVYKVDIPGLSKEDIEVELIDDRLLSVSGERKTETRNESDSYRSVERSYGKFRRQFALPENAKVLEVSAKVEDGVLTVTVPKAEKDASRAVQLK